MKLKVVGSTSKGNCYLIQNGDHYLALDAGVPWKKVEIACEFQVSKIDACLVSHHHGDHIKYDHSFLNRGIPVYSNWDTAQIYYDETRKHIRMLSERMPYRVAGGYRVVAFNVPHENVMNTAYMITFDSGEKLLYMTDFEYCPYDLSAYGINHFLIAVNHSEEIPEEANAREHRLRGHSSLEVVKNFLKVSATKDCKSVIACHLSNIYADPDKIEKEIKEVVGNDVMVTIAENAKTIEL